MVIHGLEFFDLKSQEVRQIKSSEIKVEVLGVKPKKELTIKRDETNKQTQEVKTVEVVKSELSALHITLIFIAGFISAILLMIMKPWKYFKRREKTISLKDPKILLMKLMPHKNDVEVEALVDALEKHLYSNAKLNLDKKLLKECLNKYNIH